MNRCAVRWTAVAGLVVVVGTLVAVAGPLDPPAGPVAPTGKTLTEVQPRTAINAANTPGDADSLFKITQRGSYYLTGNVTGEVGKHGIEIAASGVTIDLNGFDLVGVPAMGAFDGVSVTATNLVNIAVVNGSVRNWGDEGVDLVGTFSVINCRVADLLTSGNAGTGVAAGFTSTITGCSAYLNGGDGISVGFGGTIIGCSVYSNTLNGIVTSSGCTVSNCTVFFSTSNGIFTGSDCTISNCTTRANGLDGIRTGGSNLVLGNTCASNGQNAASGAGIHATGFDNRIEGNNCTGADRGIDVDFSGNIIIRNTCAGNTIDWVIAANNVVGPILDRRAPASAAISGFTAPDSTGSTHPNANFSY